MTGRAKEVPDGTIESTFFITPERLNGGFHQANRRPHIQHCIEWRGSKVLPQILYEHPRHRLSKHRSVAPFLWQL